jgi:hypothetical protein
VKPTDRQHLTDQRLIDTYFARVGDGSELDAAKAECEHVQMCETCARRYENLTASLERLREAAFAEADAYFTTDRLAAQRNHILRHLEGAEHPARVIPFPRTAAKPYVTRVHAPLFRWVAAAAVAGLVIGVSAGRMLYLRPGASPRAAASIQARTVQPAFRAPGTTYDGVALDKEFDEAFVSEIENAMSQQRIAALQALDALTPRVQDAVARVK